MVLVSPLRNNINNIAENDEQLNINGRRFAQNAFKTIWSYNPDDVIKKMATRWRGNHSATRLSRSPTGPTIDLNLQLENEYQFNAISSSSLPFAPTSFLASSGRKSSRAEEYSMSRLGMESQCNLLAPPIRIASYVPSGSDSRQFNLLSRENVQASIVSNTDLNLIQENTDELTELKKKVLIDLRTIEKYKNSINSTLKSYEDIEKMRLINDNSRNNIGKRLITRLNRKKSKYQYGESVDSLTNDAFNLVVPETTKHNLSVYKPYQTTPDKTNDSLYFEGFDEPDNFVMKICNEITAVKLQGKKEVETLNRNESRTGGSTMRKNTDTTKQIQINKQIQLENIKPNAYINVNQNPIPHSATTDSSELHQRSIAYFDAKYEKKEFKYRYAKIIDKHFDDIIEQYDGSQPVEVAIKQSLPLYDYYQSLTIDTPNSATALAKHMKDLTYRDPDTSFKLKEKGMDKTLIRPRGIDAAFEYNIDFQMYQIFKRLMVKRKYEASTIKSERAQLNITEKKKRRVTSAANPVLPSIGTSQISNISPPHTAKTAPLSNKSTRQLHQQQLDNYKQILEACEKQCDQMNPIIKQNNVLNQFTKPFHEDDDEEFQSFPHEDEYILDDFRLRCASCNKLLKPDKFNFDYDQYSISFETMKKNMLAETVLPPPDPIEEASMAEFKSPSRFQCKDCATSSKVNLAELKDFSELSGLQSIIGIESIGKSVDEVDKSDKNTEKTEKDTEKVAEKATVKSEDEDKEPIDDLDDNEEEQEQQVQQRPATKEKNEETHNKPPLQANKVKLQSAKSKKSTTNTVTSKKREKSKPKKNQTHQDYIEDMRRRRCRHEKHMTVEETYTYQRKNDMLPGKTFSSQRRRSISIAHLPLSKIRANYEKENMVKYVCAALTPTDLEIEIFQHERKKAVRLDQNLLDPKMDIHRLIDNSSDNSNESPTVEPTKVSTRTASKKRKTSGKRPKTAK